jgi:hypothetical protein
MVTGWTRIAGERRMLYSPVGLRLVDDLTGAAPVALVRAELDEQDAAGEWHETGIQAVRSFGDVLLYPGLGRSSAAATQPVRHYRVRLISDSYVPDYFADFDGIEFDVFPYDDDTPPLVTATHPDDVFLLPSTSYPFPGHIRVLRGMVTDALDNPVAFAEVTEGSRERVLTDTRGGFALPLRWPPIVVALQIDAVDNRTGRSGQITVTLPGDLSQGNTIIIT